MSIQWIKETFGVDKPIIAMCHMQAMPGDPGYDEEKGLEWVVEMARHDLHGLQEGGVDAVMFSNEFSLPYLTATTDTTLKTVVTCNTNRPPIKNVSIFSFKITL